MNKTEVFLDEYKKLENVAIQKYYYPKNGKAITKLIHNPDFKSIRKELEYCRDVRNLLQHEPNIDEAFAVEPSEQMIDFLRKTIEKIIKLPSVREVMIPKSKILSKSMDDFVRPAMIEMQKNSYTHIPILNNDVVVGVFSESTLMAYLIDEEIVGIEETTKFSDMAHYLPIKNHVAESFQFISQNSLVPKAKRIFKNALSNQERIGLIFITHSGESEEKLLGIITAWDLAGMR